MPPLIEFGLPHLWFVTIHLYEDRNGVSPVQLPIWRGPVWSKACNL